MQPSMFLMVNRAHVAELACSACGGPFATNPTGDKALVATIGKDSRVFFFCSACGDNIMGRVSSDDAKGHYGWDWAVPVRNGVVHERPA
ncbi:MAG TPA: hypothetical protein VEC38_10300 [Candidatus Binataceae bacterium]|nr:hypothetical protein [Candidatus Binataceae bacterium]